MNDMMGRVPPQSIEAEQSVLGAMLLDREAIASATEILTPEDFYREAHGVIFDGIVKLYQRGEPVDLITLPEQLKNTNILEQVGGVAYISDLANSVPSSSSVLHYAKIVESKSIMRKLIKASSTIMDKSYEGVEEVDQLIELAEKGYLILLKVNPGKVLFLLVKPFRKHLTISKRDIRVRAILPASLQDLAIWISRPPVFKNLI